MMTMGRAVKTVNGFSRYTQSRIETEGNVCHYDIVIDRLRESNNIQTLLQQTVGILLRASSADADQYVKMIPMIVLDDCARHVHQLAAHLHSVRFVTAGSKDSASKSQNAGQSLSIQLHRPVFHQAAEAVPDTYDFHTIAVLSSLADSSDYRIQAGAVTSCG
jgi:hypothetical protein